MAEQVLADNEKNYVVHLTNETSPYTVDVSALEPSSKYGNVTRVKLDKVKYSTDANILLSWDATTDVEFLDLEVGQDCFDFQDVGGLNNTKAAGYTGDVIVTTSATNWFATLYFTKKYD